MVSDSVKKGLVVAGGGLVGLLAGATLENDTACNIYSWLTDPAYVEVAKQYADPTKLIGTFTIGAGLLAAMKNYISPPRQREDGN